MMIPVTLFVSLTATSAHTFHLRMMNKIMKG
jgi:hypothetical protein